MAQRSNVRGSLNQARVVDAALALVDREGLDALSMRALAAEFGVQPMAFYNHVKDKAELLDLLVARVMGEMRVSGRSGQGWQKQLEAFARAYRKAFLAHPGLVSVAATRPIDPEFGERLIAPLVGAMTTEGFTGNDAMFAIQSVAVFTLGHLMAEAAPTRAGGEELPPNAAPKAYFDRWFVYGLKALIAGFKPA